MNKRAIYEGIVAEVEYDIALIKVDSPNNYLEAIHAESTTLVLPENGVFLKTPTTAFADYGVRDAILIKTMESEEFAFILLNKIGNTVKERHDKGEVTQGDLEALVVAGQTCAMWEQFGNAELLSSTIEAMAEAYNLDEPPLNTITKKLIAKRNEFSFAHTRKIMINDLSAKLDEALDNEDTDE
jgi:hypothetical protein